jgi:hypothetical protein
MIDMNPYFSYVKVKERKIKEDESTDEESKV